MHGKMGHLSWTFEGLVDVGRAGKEERGSHTSRDKASLDALRAGAAMCGGCWLWLVGSER